MLVTQSSLQLEVCLDNLRSAYNVGSIFRTCDGVAVSRVVLCGITPTPLNPKLEKTALTATHIIPWVHYCRTQDYLSVCQKKQLPIVVWETQSKAKSLFDVVLPPQSVFVFGHEINGVKQSIIDSADFVVKIPQYGRKLSLNVSAVVSIALYFWRQQHPV